jgi:SpoU rRNA methylase family enzyme
VIITQTSNEKQRTEDIANNVASLYEKQLPFIRVQDSTSQKLIAKIIQMHYSLTNSINVLDPVVDDAEIVCDSQ